MGKIKIDPEAFERTLTYVRGGMFLREACSRSGLNYHTLNGWLHKARNIVEAMQEEGDDYIPITSADDEYLEILVQVEKARAECEGLFVGAIRSAALNDKWQAAAWFLERSAPERWGRKDHLTLAGDSNQPVTVHVKFEGDQAIPD